MVHPPDQLFYSKIGFHPGFQIQSSVTGAENWQEKEYCKTQDHLPAEILYIHVHFLLFCGNSNVLLQQYNMDCSNFQEKESLIPSKSGISPGNKISHTIFSLVNSRFHGIFPAKYGYKTTHTSKRILPS